MMEAKMALVSVMRKVKFERSPDTEVRACNASYVVNDPMVLLPRSLSR